MTIEELAQANRVSVSTAHRYRRKGIDLLDREAVNEHKREIRTRRGLSKTIHRTSAPTVQQAIEHATAILERKIEELESRICGVHSELEFLVKRHPELASDLADAFGYTTAVVERIGAEE
jgi:oligoribonuclease (3'-5' exoribonuclease)